MFSLELLVVGILILAEMSTTKPRSQSRSSFLDQKLNNTLVMVTTGEDLTLNCRVKKFQVCSIKLSFNIFSVHFGF